MSNSTDDTVEIPIGQRFRDRFFAPVSRRVRLSFGAVTHVGRVRPNNEDNFLVVRRTRSRDVLFTTLPEESFPSTTDAAYCLAVADGVGGGEFGELASRLVLETVWDLAARATSWIMKLTDLESAQFRERVEAYVESVQDRLRDLGRLDPELSRMATTWTSAYVMGRDVVIINIGDSRAYVWRGGTCRQITRDHTFRELLKSSGIPFADEERLENVLVNCVSANPQSNAFPELHHVQIEEGDRLLLCTDGLTDMVDVGDIARIIAGHPDPQEACEELIQRSLDAGGRDNVTVILAAVEAEPAAIDAACENVSLKQE